jgi:hypothetical protein
LRNALTGNAIFNRVVVCGGGDSASGGVVKTYIKRLNKKAPQDYFSLVTDKYSKNTK